jgi:hypothetical protein
MFALHGAMSKLTNALWHVSEFRKIDEIMGKHLSLVEGNVFTDDYKITPPTEPIPEAANHRFGDALFNARASLDYLVYELALLGGNSEPKLTQFPICDDAATFANEIRRGRLKGLSAAHIVDIENLQPYKSNPAAASLRDLSNPDKHRTLTVISLKDGGNMKFHMPTRTRSGQLTKRMELEIKTFIALTDGRSATKELEIICDWTLKILEDFTKAFQS